MVARPIPSHIVWRNLMDRYLIIINWYTNVMLMVSTWLALIKLTMIQVGLTDEQHELDDALQEFHAKLRSELESISDNSPGAEVYARWLSAQRECAAFSSSWLAYMVQVK